MGYWWKGAKAPENAEWLDFRGDPTAVDGWSLWPPAYWRWQWSWYALFAQKPNPAPLLLYCRVGEQYQVLRSYVPGESVAVRVGPRATSFAAMYTDGTPVTLVREGGPYHVDQVRCMRHQNLSRQAKVQYRPDIVFA